MKFKYSVIGDNSQENREWLEMLWYVPFMWDEYDDDQPFITTMDSGEYTSASKDDRHHYMCSLDINCIGNPQLFKAVSAISTTTDIGKHYINNHTGQWRQCDYNMATDENIDWGDWTEATLSELINHFK